ncbi:hypothetical protein Ancab_024482 [Ancistrocladus abbreviatus]
MPISIISALLGKKPGKILNIVLEEDEFEILDLAEDRGNSFFMSNAVDSSRTNGGAVWVRRLAINGRSRLFLENY